MADKISGPKKQGQAVIGTAVYYAPYVNFGTRRMDARPYLSTALELTRAKANGTYKTEMGKAIYAALQRRYKQQIAQGVEFIGADISKAIDVGADTTAAILAAYGTGQAKALTPVDSGTLRRSIMWKMKGKEGGYGSNG